VTSVVIELHLRGTVKSLVFPYADYVDNSRNIAAVVGANVKEARKDSGLTLDDISQALKTHLGVKWSTGKLGDIESGRFSPRMETILLLALALSIAGGGVVSPRQLMDSGGPVELTRDICLTPKGYARLLDGEADSLTVGMIVGGREEMANIVKGFTDQLARAGRYKDQMTYGEVRRADDEFALADERAAKRLGLERFEFIAACFHLWGRLLSAETQHRSPEGATPQKRGRITRELLAELREYVSSVGDD
jgi:transcriptional regulator with XRE-family HTH domain